jgi:type I restriction enzyme S subunit
MKKQLKDICETITKGTTPTTLGYNYQETGINFVKIESINSYGMFEPEKFAHISDDCNIALRRSQLKENDILFSIAGAIGRTAIVNKSILPANTNQALAIIRLNNSEEYNLKFLRYQLASEVVLRQTERQKQGVAQLNLSLKDIGNLELSLPSLSDQQKIATELDTIQSAIDNKKQQLSLLDEAVKSEFVEMFGELDLSPQRTDWTELKNITTIFTGTTPSTTDEENWNGDVLWITPAEMTSDSFYIYDTERKITSKGQKSKSLSLMPVNTVLLSTRAPIGKVGIAGTQMTCNQGFKNFYCKEDVLNPIYLYFLFKSNTDYLNSKGTGTTFKELSKSAAEKIKVPVPSLELQNKFAAFVQQIDKSKFVVKKQIADLQELFNSKMQEYFGE